VGVRWQLWDRVVVPDGRRGRVVCFLEARALVWYGFGNGESWCDLSELRPPGAVQQELFDAH